MNFLTEEADFQWPLGEVRASKQQMEIGQLVEQSAPWPARSSGDFSGLGSLGARGGEREALVWGDMARQMGIVPGPLELQGSDVGWEAAYDAAHLPRAEAGA